MPVQFLSPQQRASYGRFVDEPSAAQLARFFHLDDADRAVIGSKRGAHNRLGFALQLTTVRYIGTFLEDPLDVPSSVLQALLRQLGAIDVESLRRYGSGKQRWEHAAEIRVRYGYRDWSDPAVGWRLCRWLYALCWTGTERPGVLFDRATTWLLAHKVILPGCTTLERFVARLRNRVDERLWKLLGQGVTRAQEGRLDALLTSEPQGRRSHLDRLRSGPVRVSGRSLVQALGRLQAVRELEIKAPTATIPPSRLASLARFANTAKVTAISRLPPARRLATLVAFVHCLEASAQDDVLEVLDQLLHEIFTSAAKADRKARLRTLKDLDAAAKALATACGPLLDAALTGPSLREAIFARVPREALAQAVERVEALVRPPDDVYFQELEGRYRVVRAFLPTLLRHMRFGASPAGEAVVAGFEWLREHEMGHIPSPPAEESVAKAWKPHVWRKDGVVDARAYTFCVLDGLRKALRRRDVFVSPSWRFADPRAGLLAGAEWEAARPTVCRSLGLPAEPAPALAALATELDQTYRAVAARVPNNPAVQLETVDGKTKLHLSPLERLDEPPSLVALRAIVAERMPEVDLPEILLEIAACTGFCDAFTHITERPTARVKDLTTSLCAVLLAEACNTGPEPLLRDEVESLRRDRLAWVDQNYLRDETLAAANAVLVAAQSRIPLAHAWGGGDVASADGLRFVVPVRTVHAGANPKYFGVGKGVTWYNLLSDQCSGLNAMTVPGTLRDSLILLSVVLEQETELQPTQIMTDTGAYSDVVFGLFRLLGYRFSPRLSDIGGTRFCIDPHADYGELNDLARQRITLRRIEAHWDDLLRLAGSLKLGRVPATGIMRTLQVGDHPTQLALALADFGRIDKTLHNLSYLDDEDKRRGTLVQLNRGEGRHSLARDVFHGKRGELRQRYREGQEDQLSALGLVVNIIVLWNTIYMDAVLAQLQREGYPLNDSDVSRLSPFIHEHINLLGRYSFAVPDEVARGELRPLRGPEPSLQGLVRSIHGGPP